MDSKSFYAYMWLRTEGTPYYVGKGSGNRAYDTHNGFRPPKDRSRIQIIPCPSEEIAFAYEILLISCCGRKDLGTGILHNRSDGGENPPSAKGKKRSAEFCKKLSDTKKRLHQKPLVLPSSEAIARRVQTYKRNGRRPSFAVCSKGGLAAHHLHPDIQIINGKKAGQRAIETGQIYTIQTFESCSKGGTRGGHIRWHFKRGIKKPGCPLCQ